LIVLHDLLVYLCDADAFAVEPVAEVRHDSETTPRALQATALLLKSPGIEINVDSQWTFMQSPLHVRGGKIDGCTHVPLLVKSERKRNYAELLIRNDGI